MDFFLPLIWEDQLLIVYKAFLGIIPLESSLNNQYLFSVDWLPALFLSGSTILNPAMISRASMSHPLTITQTGYGWKFQVLLFNGIYFLIYFTAQTLPKAFSKLTHLDCWKSVALLYFLTKGTNESLFIRHSYYSECSLPESG